MDREKPSPAALKAFKAMMKRQKLVCMGVAIEVTPAMIKAEKAYLDELEAETKPRG